MTTPRERCPFSKCQTTSEGLGGIGNISKRKGRKAIRTLNRGHICKQGAFSFDVGRLKTETNSKVSGTLGWVIQWKGRESKGHLEMESSIG